MIDIIFILIITVFFIVGISKGFFYIFINFISIYTGIYLAIKLNSLLFQMLSQFFNADDIILKILSFLFIFLFSVSTFSIVHKILEKLIKKSKILTMTNRILGGIFGIIFGFIAIYYTVITIEMNKKLAKILIKDSKTYKIIKKIEGHTPLLKI